VLVRLPNGDDRGVIDAAVVAAGQARDAAIVLVGRLAEKVER